MSKPKFFPDNTCLPAFGFRTMKTLCFVSTFLALTCAACGDADHRSFAIENTLFEAVAEGRLPAGNATAPDATQRTLVADGLSAICKGQTDGAWQLLHEARIGKEIYRLSLIAAKANRKGACDYSDWPEKLNFHGERFKQLVGSGDGPSVLLAALIDEQLPATERRAVVQALAEHRYGHAEAALAGMLLRGEGGDKAADDSSRAQTLLADAAGQGAIPAYLLQAQMYGEGLGVTADPAKACAALRAAEKQGSPGARQALGAANCPL